MWASFGYFEAATNDRVRGSFARRLRLGGRLVLDLFNRSFLDAHASEVEREVRPGLYRPEELKALAASHGLSSVHTVAPDDAPAMQLVLQRDE